MAAPPDLPPPSVASTSGRHGAPSIAATAAPVEARLPVLGTAAHDLDALLAELLDGTHRLGKLLPDDPRARQALAEIDCAVRRAGALTAELLALHRRIRAPRRPLELNRFLRDLRPTVRALLTTGPRLRLWLLLSRPPVLAFVRPPDLERALLDLVAESREALGEGDTLVLSTRRLDGPGGSPTACVSIAVSHYRDRSAGLPLARAFRPFLTTSGCRGARVGWTRARALVLDSGGRLRVASRPGNGTTIEILLPQAAPLP